MIVRGAPLAFRFERSHERRGDDEEAAERRAWTLWNKRPSAENEKLKAVLHLVDQLMDDCTRYGMPETESIRYRAIRERVREALGRPL